MVEQSNKPLIRSNDIYCCSLLFEQTGLGEQNGGATVVFIFFKFSKQLSFIAVIVCFETCQTGREHVCIVAMRSHHTIYI